jgi:GNAT superfamily N-acetyltransferase
MAISVRVARESDVPDIAALTLQLGYEVSTGNVASRLSRILVRGDQQFLVAELDGHAVGWVHTSIFEYIESDAFVVIGGLVVDKNFRRQGIGSLLMAQAEEWARSRGCSIVRLWSTSTRTASHRFYQDLGYTNIKTQYSFAKSLTNGGQETFGAFIPKVDQ